MTALDLDIVVTRGRHVESRHAVHAAVMDGTGRLLAFAGTPEVAAHWRSCAKPFQVHPFVADGTWETLGWGDEALALACASHGGEPEHVALARTMLASVGLDERALACGPHVPLADRGARIAAHEGGPTRLHNNCSGKHAAMLAACTVRGWPTTGYDAPEHPLQRVIADTVRRAARLEQRQLDVAVDGCGVPTFVLSVRAMATAWATLAHDAAHGDAAARRILGAMAAHPFLVGGTGRFDTLVMEASGGDVVCKVGAEGVHCLALRSRGLGLALKVADGAARAQHPAVLRLLQRLDALPEPLPPSLAPFLVAPVRDTRDAVVGEIRPAA